MCPSQSGGDFPNCTCRYGEADDNVTNSCPNPKCPKNEMSKSKMPVVQSIQIANAANIGYCVLLMILVSGIFYSYSIVPMHAMP